MKSLALAVTIILAVAAAAVALPGEITPDSVLAEMIATAAST